MRSLPGVTFSIGQQPFERPYGISADTVSQLVRRQGSHDEIRMTKLCKQFVQRGSRQIRRRDSLARLAARAGINHPPDAATFAIALGMAERNECVGDDAVIEVGNVKRSVGPKL
jgi:hypothetical protein